MQTNITVRQLDETMYLCKLNPDVPGDPKFIALIGRIVCQLDGYVFLPNVSGHKASRKAWPSVNAAIPRWTEKMGFLRLCDPREFFAFTAKSSRESAS